MGEGAKPLHSRTTSSPGPSRVGDVSVCDGGGGGSGDGGVVVTKARSGDVFNVRVRVKHRGRITMHERREKQSTGQRQRKEGRTEVVTGV